MGRMELAAVLTGAFMLASMNIPVTLCAEPAFCDRPLGAFLSYVSASDSASRYPTGSSLTLSCNFSDVSVDIYCDENGVWKNWGDGTFYFYIKCPTAFQYCDPPDMSPELDSKFTTYRDRRDRYPNGVRMTIFCRYSTNKERVVCDGAEDGGVWRFESPLVDKLLCPNVDLPTDPDSGGISHGIYIGVCVGLTVLSFVVACVVRTVRVNREKDYSWTRF